MEPVVRHAGPEKEMTPTNRLSGFGTGLATNSDSFERVPQGRWLPYSNPGGSAGKSFFGCLATQARPSFGWWAWWSRLAPSSHRHQPKLKDPPCSECQDDERSEHHREQQRHG